MVIMLEQLQMLKTRSVGFNQQQLVTVSMERYLTYSDWDASKDVLNGFQRALSAHHRIQSVTRMDDYPSEFNYTRVSLADGSQVEVALLDVDENFLQTLEIELLDGRNFAADSETEARRVIVNQTLVRRLGLDRPVGSTLSMSMLDERTHEWYDNSTIVGVVADFHLQSLHTELKPLALTLSPALSRPSGLCVRITPGKMSEVLEFMQDQWSELVPDAPFDLSFLDASIERQYRADERWSDIITYGAGLALLIDSLGTFGLSSLATARRTREIGIRRALGATITSITVLFGRDVMLLAAAASLVAGPAAYYAMQQWLQNYPYRIELQFEHFALSGAAILLIVLATASSQAVRAALRSPVDTLRCE